jgi:UDP-N-acetylglucosamine 2-epimerase (non-hydrolysing)
MTEKKKIMVVFGTRPEAIKMAPLIHELRKFPKEFDVVVTVTGQHRELLDQVLRIFDIEPDYDLNIMKPNQDLFEVSSNILLGLRDVLTKENPNLILVHGDTSTSTMSSLSAFYQKIPVGHIEAGLRTNNIYNPWPEELNRQLTSRIAKYHFTPTNQSKENLLLENIEAKNIVVTGNTVIDALFIALKRIENDPEIIKFILKTIDLNGYSTERFSRAEQIVLVTGHRRENFGEALIQICIALNKLAITFSNVDFIYPMHLNPNVRNAIADFFKENLPLNLIFIEPLEYLPFVYLMNKSKIILTDSGGIQEEAPSLGKPVLVMRETTERPEALAAGVVKLIGTNSEKIIKEVTLLLNDSRAYEKMTNISNPYGDGKASFNIVKFLRHNL